MLGLCDAGFLDQEMLVPEVTLVLATAKRKIYKHSFQQAKVSLLQNQSIHCKENHHL